ncbi:MAG: inner membrane protein [Patescibacteria group bacterium]|jgi:inner membrane protein
MMFRSHFVFGLLLFLVITPFVDSWIPFLVGIIVGVLIVDLDSKTSKVGRYWIFRPLQFFMSHRGMVHSIFFGLILSGVLAIFNLDLALGFFIGFLSHLFLDCLTKRGVAIFWPFSSKRVSGFIRSGGVVEDVFFVLVLLSDLVLLVLLLQKLFL